MPYPHSIAKHLAVFCLVALAAGAIYNGYGAFYTDPSSRHGFETGKVGFLLGMTFWSVIVTGKAIGFAAAMLATPSPGYRFVRYEGLAFPALLGVLSPAAYPLTQAVPGIMLSILDRIGLPIPMVVALLTSGAVSTFIVSAAAILCRERLYARRYPYVCRHCGYDLPGTLAAGRRECPDCGGEVELGG